MAITLNHTIVPAHDKEAAARLFARLFGLTYKGAGEHFAPVKVNDTPVKLFLQAAKRFVADLALRTQAVQRFALGGRPRRWPRG